MKVLVTGAAGFIGFHVVLKLLNRGDQVVGLDSLNDYYDVSIKQGRLSLLIKASEELDSQFEFVKANIADKKALDTCFSSFLPDRVIHLAAQAGVRYSIKNPHAYVESNLVGFTNVLEVCRHGAVSHLTYASTSSIYGANTKLPFNENDSADHPLSFTQLLNVPMS